MNHRVRHRQQRRGQNLGWQKPRGRPGASARSWTAGLPGWKRSCISRRWTLTTTEGGLKQRFGDSSSSLQWPKRLRGRVQYAVCWHMWPELMAAAQLAGQGTGGLSAHFTQAVHCHERVCRVLGLRLMAWVDVCALRRQVEEQLQEAQKLAECAAQRRRRAEAQVAALQAELEAARMQQSAHSDGDRGGESATAFQLRMLQDLVQKQEDEVKEARRLKSHVRCAPEPGRWLAKFGPRPWPSLELPMCLSLSVPAASQSA